MSDEFDAVLVGAGHNTLAAAVHLAARGWRVGIFEQAEMPGGAVKTGEYTLPGFRHDWAAMNLSLFAGSEFFKQYGEELAGHGLDFAPVKNPFASAFPDGRWCGVSTDLEATASRIASFSKKDAERWKSLAGEFGADAPHLFRLLGSSMKIHSLAYFLYKVFAERGRSGLLQMVRFLLSSPRAYLSETFETPQVRAMLAAWGMHLDFAPDIAGGAIFPYLEGMAGQAFGMVLGKGGADTIKGGGGADKLLGQAGNDTIKGQGGNDKAFGGGGADKLFGSGGNDRLLGGGGKDMLNGQAGNDRMTGQKGQDTFVFVGKIGNDVITDFGVGNDLISIKSLDGFADLGISKVKAGTLIDWGQGTILLENVQKGDIDADDFLF